MVVRRPTIGTECGLMLGEKTELWRGSVETAQGPR